MMKLRPLLLLMLCSLQSAHGAEPAGNDHPAPLERSFWIHASLAPIAQKGYWGPHFPLCAAPVDDEIRNAARILTVSCAANRLYLVYHTEIPLTDARRVFAAWRAHCAPEVELIPTLLLRMYDKPQTQVFTTDELQQLATFFKRSVHPRRLGIYDVYPLRDCAEPLKQLAAHYPEGLIRVGIQPQEKLRAPFVAAVQDTWSGLCHGKTTAQWQEDRQGAPRLRDWVQQRKTERAAIAWDLVVVAWDYSASQKGEYPGYDDAARNMPLPPGRNALAFEEIRRTAPPQRLRGFSSDLLILQANSRHPARDGLADSFYETLKAGQPYGGYFCQPLEEIADLFRRLRDQQR